MAYRAYRCKYCGKTVYYFEQEINLFRLNMAMEYHEYEKLPPEPVVIHQTECFLSEPILDSMHTAQELDRILTREVRHLKEDQLVDAARRNA